MNFEAYKDRIILALGGLLIAWLVYLTSMYTLLPSIVTHDEVTRMIVERMDHSPYLQDKQLINDRFERLWANEQKSDLIQEKLVNEITALRLIVERLVTMFSEQQKYLTEERMGRKKEEPPQ